MNLAIGSDHAGYQLKKALDPFLKSLGHNVLDIGAFDEKPSDYPDFAELVGKAILEGRAERGILICGSGVGVSVAVGVSVVVADLDATGAEFGKGFHLLDHNGQLTVLGGFCSKMGLATGPLLAGRLLVHDDYGLLINATVAALIICTVVVLPTARRMDRR
jgi:hypothetical protein